MLDVADNLATNKDLYLTESDQSRSYNLLSRHFSDNPFIGLDTVAMVTDGLAVSQIEMMITDYLAGFSVRVNEIAYTVSDNGTVVFNLKF